MTDTAEPGPYVRPDVKMFLAMLEAAPTRLHQLDVPTARKQYIDMRGLVDRPVGELGDMRDLAIPGPAGDIRARLFDPRANREPGPVLVFFHGGGFTIGDLDTHASFCAEAARLLDLPLVAVDYRLGPEAPFPAAVEDAVAAARWVASNPAELNRTATGLVLMGDSAGGNQTITTALALRDEPAAVPVIFQLPFYPAPDTSKPYPSHDALKQGYMLTEDSLMWFATHYAADVNDHRASPLLADLAGMPPALVVTASLDPLRDQGRAYAGALAAAGVPVAFREAVGNIHGFITLRQAIPSSQGDVMGALAVAKSMIVEAEGQRVMAQAAG